LQLVGHFYKICIMTHVPWRSNYSKTIQINLYKKKIYNIRIVFSLPWISALANRADTWYGGIIAATVFTQPFPAWRRIVSNLISDHLLRSNICRHQHKKSSSSSSSLSSILVGDVAFVERFVSTCKQQVLPLPFASLHSFLDPSFIVYGNFLFLRIATRRSAEVSSWTLRFLRSGGFSLFTSGIGKICCEQQQNWCWKMQQTPDLWLECWKMSADFDIYSSFYCCSWIAFVHSRIGYGECMIMNFLWIARANCTTENPALLFPTFAVWFHSAINNLPNWIFLGGDSPASEFYVSTFQNTVISIFIGGVSRQNNWAKPSQRAIWRRRLARSATRRTLICSAIPAFDRIPGPCNKHLNL